MLAGRGERRLHPLAEELRCEARTANLDDPSGLARALEGIAAVLNAAGPFAATAEPLVDACLAAGAHYLDVNGEIAVFEALRRRDAEARSRGLMILPGAGFVVVPSDCLAGHVARRLPGARRLRLGVSRATTLSRGTAATMVGLISDRVEIRRGGRIVRVPAGILERAFDYGRGPSPSLALGWGDVATAYHTTAIPDVEVYLELGLAGRLSFRYGRLLAPLLRTPPWQVFLGAQTRWLPEGPEPDPDPEAGRVIVAEAEDGRGRRAASRLRVPEPYTLTTATAVGLAERVLAGDFEAGFQTPARAYGPDLALTFEGVEREDL